MVDQKKNRPPAEARVFDAADIGRIIRLRRKELGYTQEYLASLSGFSPRLIGEIERGRKTVGIQKIVNLATGLGIDIIFSVRGR
jgi:transcriptional regulator with XRE-family HTH domain